MKRILKAGSMTGGSSLFNLLASVARIKVVALLVGTIGVGVISYLINFVQLAVSITTLGLGSGIVKLTSEFEAEGAKEDLDHLKGTALSTTFWFSMVVTVVLWLAAPQVSILLTGDMKYSLYVRVISLSIPCLTLGQSLTSLLNGFKAIREMALITVWGAVFSLIIVVPLVWKFRVTGVVWHFLLQSLLLLVIGIVFYRKCMRDPHLLPFLSLRKLSWRLMKMLAAFGIATFLLGVFQNLAYLIVRRLIESRYGQQGVGLYQVPYGLTLQYLNIILTALLTYSLPTMSGLRDDKEGLTKQFNLTMKVSLMTVVPIIAVLLLLKKYLVLFLYSREFLPSVHLLEVQLLGDFFKVIAFVFGVVVLSQARLKMWLLLDLFWDGIFVAMSFALLPKLGLTGIALAFLAGYGAMAVAYGIFVARGMKILLDGSNLRICFVSLIALLMVAAIAHNTGLLVSVIGVAAILPCWMMICFERKEILAGWATVRHWAWREDEPISGSRP